jgi:hypothetical protein
MHSLHEREIEKHQMAIAAVKEVLWTHGVRWQGARGEGRLQEPAPPASPGPV